MSKIPDLKLKPLKEIIGNKTEEKQQQEERAIKPAKCFHCRNNYYTFEGPETEAYEKNKDFYIYSFSNNNHFDFIKFFKVTYKHSF